MTPAEAARIISEEEGILVDYEEQEIADDIKKLMEVEL